MIFFVDNDGTIIKNLPSPVYQGAANTNTIYLIAPFASGLTASVAFQLPNGIVTEAKPMTQQNSLQGIINKETGEEYSGWTYAIPSEITEYYGTVTAQFYFYTEVDGMITATSATSFQVAKGVPAVLPDEPSADVYEQILSVIASLQKQLNNGAFAAVQSTLGTQPTHTARTKSHFIQSGSSEHLSSPSGRTIRKNLISTGNSIPNTGRKSSVLTRYPRLTFRN